MKQSVLLRQVFIVILISLFCVALFSVIAFEALFQFRFVHTKGQQLLPKARALGRVVSKGETDEDIESALQRLFGPKDADFSAFLGEYILIYNAKGEPVIAGVNDEVADPFMRPLVETVMDRREVVASGKPFEGRGDMVLAGCPIYRDSDTPIGCVFLAATLGDSLASAYSFIGSWPLVLFLSLPFILLLVYLLMRRIIKPIRQMQDVANAMSAGNFDLRADDSVRGEIGQLAHTLNYLCTQLSAKLSELTVERDRLRQSVDGLNEGFLSLDAGGSVIHCNPALARMFPGASSYENKQLRLIPDEAVWRALDKALHEGKGDLLEMPWGEKVFHVTVTPISQGGAVALLSDITENARLEKTRRDYVANVSHELRTPLTAMRALVEPLRDGMVKSDATRERYYDIILSEIIRLSHLIDNLMELSRLQSRQIEVASFPMSIEEMLQDLSEKYRTIAEEKHQKFDLFLPPALPKVVSDEGRVEEVLVILLDNAMKYTPEGGSIRLGARIGKDAVEVFVRDNGIGITASDLPYVFDRFYKADNFHSGSGSGLGLSIAKELLSQMGEKIECISTPGSGSEFFFTLHTHSGS